METLVIERGIPIPAKPEGSCLHCSRMPTQGRAVCDFHLDKLRKLRAAKKALGLCQWGTSACANKPAANRTICREHLRAMVIYSQKRRNARIAKKICIDCGIRPRWWTLRCILCRFEVRDYQFVLPAGARKALYTYRRNEKIDARREQAQIAVEWTEDQRIARIFTMRHGLEDDIDRTLEEIGAEFSITRERVRQIEERHLAWLGSEGFDVTLLRQPFEFTQRKALVTRTHLVSNAQRKKAECHHLVRQALESGELVKGLCKICQAVDVVGHHEDYDKPLEVEWLCRKHHMDTHRGFWLDKIKGSSPILDALRQFRPRQEEVARGANMSVTTLKKILTNAPNIRPQYAQALIQYIERETSGKLTVDNLL